VYGISIGCGGVDAVRGVDVAMGTGDGDVNIIPLPVDSCCCGSLGEANETVE
jgi:hypothetical protein